MSAATLLLEIGCEEIPARMIPGAAEDLGRIVTRILDQAGLTYGATRSWGGSRRLTVRVERVQERQADREEQILGPPVRAAFTADGEPTKAAVGFAAKQGVKPEDLVRIETDKGLYAGFKRIARGSTVGEIVARDLPGAVAAMSFSKTMRWAEGRWRWVRPVHWLLALHGRECLELELFGVRSGSSSTGHRFLSSGPVRIGDPDRYEAALEEARVIADPARRRTILGQALDAAAEELGGSLVEDRELLEEVADLVEWPGVVPGRFAPGFLDLPRELLITTLRHHQKCFSVQDAGGDLVPAFLAVANTDRDPAGHVQRGNEWVVGGRLEDARFFWREDRKRTLASRSADLEHVVFHAKVGSYADKAKRMESLARRVAKLLALDSDTVEHCAVAARLAKNDLVSGTVGEFPELQGMVGGLLLAAERKAPQSAEAIYAHYRPAGPDDALPPTDAGCVVSLADKLDSVSGLIGAGEIPTGSRDPFGLRRASSGIFRILIERGWPLSLRRLGDAAGADTACLEFLLERLRNYLRDAGSTINEIQAVLRPKVNAAEALDWGPPDIMARLEAIGSVRQRDDFAHLADLTKRVDNILVKGEQTFSEASAALKGASEGAAKFAETKPAAQRLWKMIPDRAALMEQKAGTGDYAAVIDILAEFVAPVEQFFVDVLVLDPNNPEATLHRKELLAQLSGVLTRCFDIRELAGQAERRQDRG
jgi:glycyl-tRNA synthetase beta chain